MKKISLASCIVIVLFSITSCSKNNDGITSNDPEACFTISKDTIDPGDLVTFTSCTKNATSIIWDFGDGASGISGDVVTHPYYTGGIYTISLTAANGTAHNVAQHMVAVRSAQSGQYKGICTTYDVNNSQTDYIGSLAVNISLLGTKLTSATFKAELATDSAVVSGTSFTWTTSAAPYTYYGSGTLTDNGIQKKVSMSVAIRNGQQSLGTVKYDGIKQ